MKNNILEPSEVQDLIINQSILISEIIREYENNNLDKVDLSNHIMSGYITVLSGFIIAIIPPELLQEKINVIYKALNQQMGEHLKIKLDVIRELFGDNKED